MLLLVFQLGDDRYAIEATHVVEVLPLVHVKAIPQAPTGIAGAINYRGTPVPVVDMCAWTLRRDAGQRMSTRLIVVRTGTLAAGLLALKAEYATDCVRIERSQFVAPGVQTPGAPYLGPVATDAQGRLVQWIEIERLLPHDVAAALSVAGSISA